MELQFLNRLKKEQADYAFDALKRPAEKTEFEYGYRVGVLAGLLKSEEILIALLKSERDDDKDL